MSEKPEIKLECICIDEHSKKEIISALWTRLSVIETWVDTLPGIPVSAMPEVRHIMEDRAKFLRSLIEEVEHTHICQE